MDQNQNQRPVRHHWRFWLSLIVAQIIDPQTSFPPSSSFKDDDFVMNVPSASGASTSTVKIFIFNLAVIDKPNSGLHSLTKPTCDQPCSLEYFDSGWYSSHHSHAATNGSSNLALYSIRRNAKSAWNRACSLEYFDGCLYFSHHIQPLLTDHLI